MLSLLDLSLLLLCLSLDRDLLSLECFLGASFEDEGPTRVAVGGAFGLGSESKVATFLEWDFVSSIICLK